MGEETKEAATEEVKVVTAKGELLRKIEQAGKLQAQLSKAQSAYNKCRGVLDAMLKEEVDDDVPVYGRNYWTVRSHDSHDKIDPIDFLKRVTHQFMRKKVLSVKIGVAREELEKEDLDFLVKNERDESTTLHVHKINKEGGTK